MAIIGTFKSSMDKGIFNCHYTDAGNAEALALLYGDKLRYVHGVGWHLWAGQYWKPDAEKEAMQCVKRLARKRQVLVAQHTDPDDKSDYMYLAMKLENTAKVNSCLKMAESTKPFSCLADSMDTKPMLLVCPNGTVELDTSYLREARQADLITHCTNVPYDRDAKAPRWAQFLREIFVVNGIPDKELIHYVKKVLGFALTGDVTERCCFIGHGIGANGKTTLLNILGHILGTYYGTTPFSNLLVKQGDSISNDIAALRGKRLVSAVEVAQVKYLDEVKVKQVTGGDKVACRFLYHEYFEYYPTYKIFLACNHKPRIKGTDEAIWDRLKLIPFNARFEKGVNADLGLLSKLKNEAEGILAWLVEGCLDWQAEGLGECQAVRDNTKAYRIGEDAFARFLDEKIEPRAGNFVTVQEVWVAHNEWAKSNGEAEIVNTNRLGMEMGNRGYKSVRNKQQRGYVDIIIV